MITAAMFFNSGVLLFADAEAGAGAEPVGAAMIRRESRRLFPRQHGAYPGGPCSVFAISATVDWPIPTFEDCQNELDLVPAVDCTIDRLRETVEHALAERNHRRQDDRASEPDLPLLVVLYSSCEQRYALFRSLNATLQEVSGYDCQGAAAYLGHQLIRDRYDAARSMDALDLATVFSIAVDTLDGVRECHHQCGQSTEMVVLFADGHVSDVQRIAHDTSLQRNHALTRLAGGSPRASERA